MASYDFGFSFIPMSSNLITTCRMHGVTHKDMTSWICMYDKRSYIRIYGSIKYGLMEGRKMHLGAVFWRWHMDARQRQPPHQLSHLMPKPAILTGATNWFLFSVKLQWFWVFYRIGSIKVKKKVSTKADLVFIIV